MVSTYSGYPWMRDITTQCLLLSTASGTGKPCSSKACSVKLSAKCHNQKSRKQQAERERERELKNLHEGKFLESSKARQIEPIITTAMLQIITLRLDSSKRYSTKSVQLHCKDGAIFLGHLKNIFNKGTKCFNSLCQYIENESS